MNPRAITSGEKFGMKVVFSFSPSSVDAPPPLCKHGVVLVAATFAPLCPGVLYRERRRLPGIRCRGTLWSGIRPVFASRMAQAFLPVLCGAVHPEPAGTQDGGVNPPLTASD